ncbi:hypothetical protein DFQ13_11927 [Actinokineospora spheciospongiae]|nr:hypothetical protein DFQ13_11927 [Actinokineospora spheciospongiae]
MFPTYSRVPLPTDSLPFIRRHGECVSPARGAEAAALPLTTITAWETLFERMGLTADSTGTLLVVGARAASARWSSSSPAGSPA